MSATVVNNKRIAKNTLFLYIRMLLVMAVSIYTTRVVLDILGVTDYGIYNVVGGVVAFLGFLNSSMANAVQRFLSFELGKGDLRKTNHIFCISMIAHIGIAIIIFIALELIGPWFIKNYMDIPIERLSAALWVFQCSIITTVFSILQVPYNALIIAKERMGVYAWISIVEVFLRLLIVYILLYVGFDKLKLYAVLQMMITIGILVCFQMSCRLNFVESQFHFVKDRNTLREIASFASWNLIGEFGWAMTNQGVDIVLNIFCGPVVNAARGISNQVNGAVMRFINNFQVALNPQIIKSYSIGEYKEMEKLVGRGTRFSYFLLLFLSLPLILEMDYVLNLWLVDIPYYAKTFCQLILVYSLVSIITNLLAQVVRAYGKIRNYQVATAVVQLLNFPLSYLCLFLGFSPVTTIIVAIFIQIIIGIQRLYFVRKLVNYDIVHFIKSDIYTIFNVTICCILLPVLFVNICPVSFFRFIGTTIISCLSISAFVFMMGIEKSDRKKIINYVIRIKDKIINGEK